MLASMISTLLPSSKVIVPKNILPEIGLVFFFRMRLYHHEHFILYDIHPTALPSFSDDSFLAVDA